MTTTAAAPAPTTAAPPVLFDKKRLCAHCRDPLPAMAAPIVFSGKNFCCEGCRTVFEILDSNGLCAFYDLSDAPGLSQKKRGGAAGAWAVLDDPEVRDRLTEFSDGRSARATFSLPDMHCASCIWLLEQLWRLDSGVQSSRVDFLQKTLSLRFDEQQTSLRKLAALLAALGYPPELNLASGTAAPPPVGRSFYLKIGLAGFAFGNIMLLSFPEYLGLERAADPFFFKMFGWLNLLLAVPVLLFAARDYFVSAWTGIKNRHLNIDLPLATGMAALFGRSAYEIMTGTGAGYMDSFTGLVFFLNIGRWAQQRVHARLSFERDYRSFFPLSARVKRPGGAGEEAVPVTRLAPGDTVLVRNGELLPADGILLRGGARIDYSFVTGEAEPVQRSAGEKVFAGGRQSGPAIEVALTRAPSQSYLTQLWNDASFKNGEKSRASLLADRAGRWFTGIVIGVSAGAFLFWAPRSMGVAVNAFTAVLIVACPCAVALAIPFALGGVMRTLGKHGFYLKNLSVIESLGQVRAVVFDKTGTITESASGGGGLSLEWAGDPLSFHEKTLLKSLARHSAHPISQRAAELMGEVPVGPVAGFEEVAGQGIRGEVDGVEVVFGKKDFPLKSQPLLVSVSDATRFVDRSLTCESGLRDAGQRPADEAFRVGGPHERMPFSEEKGGTFLMLDGHVRGRFLTKTELRPGLPAVASFFKKKGADLMLLSGDNDREAAALLPFFEKKEAMFFEKTPAEKLAFIKNLEENGRPSLMLGDGLNDAGALRAATVGVAVSEGAGQFAPACDAILDAGAFGKLPQFLRLAEAGVWLVKGSFAVAFFYNIVGLSFAVTGQLSPLVAAILMPVSSATVILWGVAGSRRAARRLGL